MLPKWGAFSHVKQPLMALYGPRFPYVACCNFSSLGKRKTAVGRRLGLSIVDCSKVHTSSKAILRSVVLEKTVTCIWPKKSPRGSKSNWWWWWWWWWEVRHLWTANPAGKVGIVKAGSRPPWLSRVENELMAASEINMALAHQRHADWSDMEKMEGGGGFLHSITNQSFQTEKGGP